MPWNLRWLDDSERVVLLVPAQPWEWDDMEETFHTANALTGGKPYTVDMIIEFTSDFKMPPNQPGEHVVPFVRLRERILNAPENRGLAILVNVPLYIESIVRSTKSIIKDQAPTDNIKFAESLDDALAMIEKARLARDEP